MRAGLTRRLSRSPRTARALSGAHVGALALRSPPRVPPPGVPSHSTPSGAIQPVSARDHHERGSHRAVLRRHHRAGCSLPAPMRARARVALESSICAPSAPYKQLATKGGRRRRSAKTQTRLVPRRARSVIASQVQLRPHMAVATACRHRRRRPPSAVRVLCVCCAYASGAPSASVAGSAAGSSAAGSGGAGGPDETTHSAPRTVSPPSVHPLESTSRIVPSASGDSTILTLEWRRGSQRSPTVASKLESSHDSSSCVSCLSIPP
mmetsp:Transcript_54378/g.143115  ORF Transcript_54378/g.143115 Transcript_54378/m.143115 type:complete len:265 (+) Transcript_54378:45-839(+)